jgi:hypothetical protein
MGLDSSLNGSLKMHPSQKSGASSPQYRIFCTIRTFSFLQKYASFTFTRLPLILFDFFIIAWWEELILRQGLWILYIVLVVIRNWLRLQ